MKICACGCGQEFEPRRDGHKYYNAKCARRAYYRGHREEERTNHRRYVLEHREEIGAYRIPLLKKLKEAKRKYLRMILEERGCQRCGITDFRVLVFHHRDPSQRDFNVATGSPTGRERLDKEIAKCDILCWNCHALTHWEAKNGE